MKSITLYYLFIFYKIYIFQFLLLIKLISTEIRSIEGSYPEPAKHNFKETKFERCLIIMILYLMHNEIKIRRPSIRFKNE